MKIPAEMPRSTRLKGFRFPREIIAYAVWAQDFGNGVISVKHFYAV